MANITAARLLTTLLFFFATQVYAQDRFASYSHADLQSLAKQMAESVSRSSPSQIDSITTLLGAVFVRDTNTFIYKYNSTQALDSKIGQRFVATQTCSNPIRKELLHRGIAFEHRYTTPSGEKVFRVTGRDC